MTVIARDNGAADHLVYAWPLPIGPECEVACSEDEQVVMCPAWMVGDRLGPGRHRWRTPDPTRPVSAFFVLTTPVEVAFDMVTGFVIPQNGQPVRIRATGSLQVRCADPGLLIAQFVGLPFDNVNDGVLRSVRRSVERMLAKNPLQLSRIFDFKPGSSVYARAETLMHSDSGLIGLPWSTMREAWFSDSAQRLILLPYGRLVANPQATIARLYSELGEPTYPHDFDNVVYDEPGYDSQIGMPGLHKVRAKVSLEARTPCIPHDLFAKYASTQFWERAELNTRGVTIL